MREVMARFAVDWLEKMLLPLALGVAGGSVDDALALPPVNCADIPEFANEEALTLCTQRPLFCAAVFAAALVEGDDARRPADAIQRLMWRDAVEMAIARDLDMALNLDHELDVDVAGRCSRAMGLWDRWRETDARALDSQRDFLSDCVEQHLWEDSVRPRSST